MELGSLTDWISSLSTAGTLLVAYMAYKKAPDWISTKRNESGFEHVTSMMAESDKIAAGLIRLYFDVLITSKESPNFNDVSKKVDNYAYEALLLKFKLKSCRRWKVKSSTEVQLLFSTLRDFCNVSKQILAMGVKPESSDELTKHKNEIERLSTQLFNQDIEKSFTFNTSSIEK
ncbi:hypothetical protein [Serratia marcescens]|uniref:hypothetical protein n=1 Tax=Serratia marcescens TaxID=615 RepID=UPI0011B85401|nr:hypothetical protein [Serratia marcescens]MDS0826516.1 hypothetical protein [Serratia marcescens]